ncbi:MurR/RpiR family transcriptional regulator [Variovorax sp. HJSM1_2]|uniref:MurR/RpiR family transcriptional regulator n=1 Tax=Variovorax sp. HJSM1_2 TaxID=3366263 RepID=UPI003BC55F29
MTKLKPSSARPAKPTERKRTAAAPKTKLPEVSPAEQLLQSIREAFDSLSRQLKVIARYVEQHRDHIGLDRIQDVAERCGVQPSAVIRFAKHFGFSGYTEMQKIFRDGIAKQIAPNRDYQARIRSLIEAAQGQLSSADIAHEFIGGSIAGMQELQRDLHSTVFDEAVAMLVEAPTIWVAGSRRSFPVATYLVYALQHTDKRIELLSGLGGMSEGQLRGLGPDDVMVVVSFSPYAEESMQCAQAAVAAGARLIAITDSQMSPLADLSSATLVVPESATFGFRALTNTMCLAQSLFIALAYQTELAYTPVPPIAGGPVREL